MDGHLVDLFTKLSQEILKHELQIGNEEFERKRKIGVLNKYIGRLRRKCFDVLLRNQPEVDYSDPCKTPYGADWSPSILLLDYGGELAKYGLEQANTKLTACIKLLGDKGNDHLNELFKLIFMLRDSCSGQNEELKSNFLSTVSHYSMKSNTTQPTVLNDHFTVNKMTVPSEFINIKYSTGVFESDPSKFVSSDFDIKKISSRNSSFTQVANNLCSSEHSLWDNFVEKPITYKLRNLIPLSETADFQANSCASGENYTNGFKLNKTKRNEIIKNCDNYWTEVNEIEEQVQNVKNKYDMVCNPKEYVLFPILTENSLKLGDYESCFVRKLKPKKRIHDLKAKNSFFKSSASIILALWEQEYKFKYSYETELEARLPELRVLELNEYLKDVRLLLVGIATETFKLNKEDLSFTMSKNTCLEGVTPNTLVSFSKEYLDIGACYVRLKHCTDFSLKKHIISGFKDCRIISKVFLMSVHDYLCRHSQYVLKVPLTLGLLEFKACVRFLQPIASAVADFCKVTEDIRMLPQGGQLLTYLMTVTTRLTNKYAIAIFLSFLKACCEAYIVNLLQDWMFQGLLNRHHADFFVEHRPKKLRHKDRAYYLSFFMFEERVPSFLKGLHNKIFNCGKTVHLLKLIQPDGKLCRLLETRTYPKMKLCLSEEELEEQHKVFMEYSENVSKICGGFTSIASLRQDQLNRQRHYEKYILDVKREQEKQREIHKKESMEEMRRKREEQNQWLTKQIRFAEEERKRKRDREEMESRLFMEEALRIADAEKRIIEEEKTNMINYYEELMHQVDKRTESATLKRHANKLNDKNALLKGYRSNNDVSFICKEPTNDLTVAEYHTTDSEGNLIPHSNLDVVNSNATEITLNLFLDDLENKNASDVQIEILISSRKDYQNQTQSDLELDRLQTSSTALLDNEPKNDLKVLVAPKNFESEADVRKGLGISEKNADSLGSEALRNKRKVLGSEFELLKIPDSGKKSVISAANKDVQSNKRKMMSTEYGIGDGEEKVERKVIPPAEETEAQRNKRKIMSSEYGTPKSEGAVCHGPKVETEAQKNKAKVMSSEYDLRKIEKEKVECPPPAEETEAQKNKKKVMASEFASAPETKEVPKRREHDTEAQKNKKRVMECEFGGSKEVGIPRRVNSAEAQRNKDKVMGIEYGNETRPKTACTQKSEIPNGESPDLKDEMSISEEFFEMGALLQSSFTEKSLEIFNKTRSMSNDMRFFTLQDVSSEHSLLQVSFPSLNERDVRVIFNQQLRKKGSKDHMLENVLQNMNVTKFMNLARKSVLIPLQVQEEIANEALFNHLLKEENLLLHLDALRNYFFLNDGEFSRRLTHNIFATLAKCTEPSQFFKRSTLNKIVYEALNFTIHSNEPCVQNVSFEIVQMPEFLSHASHDVLSPFELSYQVKWPLNIILTEKALGKYKRVFHFLLKLKRINWTLNENFSYLSYSCRDKRVNSRLLMNSLHYHKIHVYRHAMSQFMRTLENYVSSCSLQYSWLNFQKDLESVKNLDQLYDKHVKYVKEVLKRCFLTSESHELESCINKLIELSLKFHYSTKTSKWILVDKKYQNSKFDVLKATFGEFCELTTEFLKTLRKKIHIHHDLRPHEILIEKFNLIL
ncbi:UNVERIFIED_CONTAM: hypothetical protein PYX00_001845 [Menopon gallinae]|uniref:Gamma-tubulin complex component 6 n=1 Tax=Menopon gallinae TaxID=328185 RepID=A0AAW2IFB8_9NEOP